MEKSKFIEKFNYLVKNVIDDSEVISLWNEYATENCPDYLIYENEEDVINELFTNVYDTLIMAIYSDYDPDDKYMWVNAKGKLASSDYIDDMPINIDELAEHIQDGLSEEDIDKLFEKVKVDE